MRLWLGESESGGRCAEEGERTKGDRLIVAASGRAPNDYDGNGRDNDPQRRENGGGKPPRKRGDECREHHDGDAKYHEPFARAEIAHGVQWSIIERTPICSTVRNAYRSAGILCPD